MTTLPQEDCKDIDVDVASPHASPETDFVFANRPDVFDAASKGPKRTRANAELSGIRYFG
eukprot:3726805-Alexandrium_andersonii.AAC.1